MARKQRTLKVIYSDRALQEIDEIWTWNERTFGGPHASAYVNFLMRHIDALSDNYADGEPVSVRPEYRFIIIRRTSRGYGHVVIYDYDDNAVNVKRIFHTAQEWETRFARET